MSIVVATTLTTFAMDDPDTWGSWLLNAEAIRQSHPDGVAYFCAIETDARGEEPFRPLCDRLSGLDGEWWTYHLDDGRIAISTANRLRHLVAGQNFATEYALADKAVTHMLFLAADLEPPVDALPKLLELDHPLVGGHVPTYCLDGPAVRGAWDDYAGTIDVREHMATAAFVLIRRDLLRYVRWRWDLDAGMSDDPCLHYDARTFHGVETLVRHDCVGIHHPESIGPIESRGHDLTVLRPVEGSSPDPEWRDLHAEGRGA